MVLLFFTYVGTTTKSMTPLMFSLIVSLFDELNNLRAASTNSEKRFSFNMKHKYLLGKINDISLYLLK